MNAFADNVSTSGTNAVPSYTANGALTNSTSTSALTDFFFLAGAARTMSEQDITAAFARAYGEDGYLALRLLLWTRDAREGAGERETFRRILRWLDRSAPEALLRVLPRVPELGRWDDLLVVESKDARKYAVEMIRAGLASGNCLLAKWLPRKTYEAKKLREELGLSPKSYRKLLVGLSITVETQMCAQKWNEIDYNKVPSVASARYRKAFQRHSPIEFGAYAEKLVKGEAKVNASAIFPHDVVKSIKTNYGSADSIKVANAQWAALPDFVGDGSFLPVVDVSASMDAPVSGSSTAMDVSTSLGIYLSERNKGAFKDIVVTFSENPTIQRLTGTLKERLDQTIRLHWGMTTNLQRAFSAILDHAKRHDVPTSDMPKTLLIISDMEFNDAAPGTNYDGVRAQYEASGYALPKIVFWNVKGRTDNVPVTVSDVNTALVSGFSPSIIRSVLGNGSSATETMLETILVSRYDLAD